MGYKSSSLLCVALLLAVSCAVQAFDITKILEQYPELSSFSKYITETKLADQINSRNTITVLAVDNGAISAISGKSPDAIKAVISTHVVLDYYDEKKLMEALGGNETLTTLYQASGLAVNQQGFLKVALVGEGEVAFGSAASGAAIDSELVKTVTSEPYNISVLQVSKPIVFPGADKASASAPPQQQQQGAKSPQPAQDAKAPMPANDAKAPTASASAPSQEAKSAAVPTASTPSEEAKGAEAPTASTSTPSEAAKGAEAPSASAPSEAAKGAETPSASAPSEEQVVATPPSGDVANSPADAPQASSPVAQAPGPAGATNANSPSPSPSGSSTTKFGFVGAVMAFASLLVVL